MRARRLTAAERVIVRALWEGQSQKELAAAQGWRVGRVHNALLRAKARLRLPSTIALMRWCVRMGVLVP